MATRWQTLHMLLERLAAIVLSFKRVAGGKAWRRVGGVSTCRGYLRSRSRAV